MKETAGVDFSTIKPGPAQLVEAGFRFVAGYLKPIGANNLPNPRELSAEVIAAYRAHGLAVVAVYESTAARALGGTTAGLTDGAIAKSRAAVLGYPSDRVIFAAVDFQVTTAQLPTVLAYLDGFAQEVGHPMGAYGSFWLVEQLAPARTHWWLWQTAAWSGGQLSAHANLYQRNVKHWPDVAGTDEDVLCRPLPWFGPIAVVEVPPAPPVPAPPASKLPTSLLPAPGLVVPEWRANRGDRSVHVENLQRWGNGRYPLYCAIPDPDPTYGPLTVEFVRQFAHRSGIVEADGRNIGPRIAAALAVAGFRG